MAKKRNPEPLAEDEDGPIEVFVEVDDDDPEVLALGKVRKYERLPALNKVAVAFTVLCILACLGIGIGLGSATWYAVDAGSGASARAISWGPVRTCGNNSDCSIMNLDARNTSINCTLSSSDLAGRFGIVWALGAFQAVVVALVGIFAISINCRPTRSGQVLAAGVFSIVGACSGAACVILFALTMGDWYHCDSTYCGTVTISPCSEGISYGSYIFIAGIGAAFIAGILAFVLRSLHYSSKRAAKAEVVADREIAEIERVKKERLRERREKAERARLAKLEAERAHAAEAAAAQQRGGLELVQEDFEDPTAAEEPQQRVQEEEAPFPVEEEYDDEELEEPEPIYPTFEIAGARDWVFDDRSRFYYSHVLNMFWDPSTQKYFDVETNVWRATPN